MKTPEKFYKIFSVIMDLSNTALKKLEDYENNLVSNTDIKKKFYNIEFVYMHSIILDISKILSVAGSDKSGLRELKNICLDKEIKQRIADFEKEYEKITQKLKANRNRIIAHVDISDLKHYSNMGFSEVEINSKRNDQKEYLKFWGKEPICEITNELENLKATSSENERYSPSDFILEIPRLKIMMKEIIKISHDVNFHFYTCEEKFSSMKK